LAEKQAKEKAEKDLIIKKRSDELRPYIIFIRDYNGMINMSEVEYQKEFKDIYEAAKQHYEYEAKEKLKQEAILEEQKKQGGERAAGVNEINPFKNMGEKLDKHFRDTVARNSEILTATQNSIKRRV